MIYGSVLDFLPQSLKSSRNKCYRLLLVLAWVCAVQCDYRGKQRGPPRAPHPPLPPKIHYGPRPPPSQVFYGPGGGPRPRPRPHSRPSGGIRGGPYPSFKGPPKPHFPVGPPPHSHHPGPHGGSSQSLLSFSGVKSQPHQLLDLGGQGPSFGGGGHGLGFGGQSHHGLNLGGGPSYHGLGLGSGPSHHGLSLGAGASHHGLSLGAGPSHHGLSLGSGPSHHAISFPGESQHALNLGGGGLSSHGLLNHAGPASQAHHGFLSDIKQHSHLLLDHKPASFSQGVLHHRLRPQQPVKETFSHGVLLNQHQHHQTQPFNHGFLEEAKPHLNSVLLEDDNKGPIHTIPAPNLSHADKPHGYQGHGGGGHQGVGFNVAHGLGLGNVEIHHSQGYEVHQEPETHDQTGVAPDGRPAYYAPDPDPSLPPHKIPATSDPFSHPSNGKQPLDLVIQQQQEQQQQQQFGGIFQQQQHQQQHHGDLFLQQQQQQNKFNDIFVQQHQQNEQQGQLTPDNFLQLFNYGGGGGGGQGGGDFPQQPVDSYGVPVGQESQRHEFHQSSQGNAGGHSSHFGPDRQLSGGVDKSLVLKTIREEFSPNFQSFNYDEQRDAAGAGSELRPKVVQQRNTVEGTRGESLLLGDSFSTLPSREAAETLATLQAAGDIISQVQNEVREVAVEEKRPEYRVETRVSQSQSEAKTRKKEEAANPSVNEVRGDIPVNEEDYEDEEEEEENVFIVRPQVGPIPGSVFYDNTKTSQAINVPSYQEAVTTTTTTAPARQKTIEDVVSDLTTRQQHHNNNNQKAVGVSPTYTRHNYKEVSVTPRPTHARPSFAIREDEPTYIESLPTFHDAVPSYTRTTRPITQDDVTYAKTTRPQDAVPTYNTRTTRPANQKKTTDYTRSKPSRPSTQKDESSSDYDYQGGSDHEDQEDSDGEEVPHFSQEFGARIKSTKKSK